MAIPQFLSDPQSLTAFKLAPWLAEARATGVAPEVRAFALGFPLDTKAAGRQNPNEGLAAARGESLADALRYPPDVLATLNEAVALAREAVPGHRGRDVVTLLTPMARQLLSRAWGDVFLEAVEVSDRLPTVAQIVSDPMTSRVPMTRAEAQILGEQLTDAVRQAPERRERIEMYIERATGAALDHFRQLQYTAFPPRPIVTSARIPIETILQEPTDAPVPASHDPMGQQAVVSTLLEHAERFPETIPVLDVYAARLPGLAKRQALLGLTAFTRRPVVVRTEAVPQQRLLREIDELEAAFDAEQQSRRTKQTEDEPHPVARHLANRR